MGVGSTRGMPGLLKGEGSQASFLVLLKAGSTLSSDTDMPHRYSKRGI